MLLHASCVSIGGKAVLLFGESGSGKSDLALRLIDGGAKLVGDDQVVVRKSGEALLASPAERIHGMVEARGVGIMHLPYAQDVQVALAVKLVSREAVERMPPPQFFDCLGLQVPLLSLHAFDHSTPAKIRFYLSLRAQ
jgi:HPr kinase/phosphorylase